MSRGGNQYVRTPEIKAQISATLRRRYALGEIATWNKGRKGLPSYTRTPENNEKNRLAHLGKKHPWTSKYNRLYKRGTHLSEEQKRAISRSLRRARRSTHPIWNKGLTKDSHPSLLRMANKLSVLQKGVPRPRGHNSKSGTRRFWYYGKTRRIRMRSRWEVAFAQYLDSIGIAWLYEPVCFVMNVFSYTPDFWIPAWKTFVEIKGHCDEKVLSKLSVFRRHYGAPLGVFMGDDLQKLGILDAHYKVIRKGRRPQ